jgi:hypothetical protein
MRLPSAKDLPDVAAALREDGLPAHPSVRWWATKLLVKDGFWRGLSLAAIVALVMAVLKKHPERSKDLQSDPDGVAKQTHAYARSFFSRLPTESALGEAVTTIVGLDAWCCTRDIGRLVLLCCRLCVQARGCQCQPDSFTVPVAVALVQRWLASGTAAAASRLLGLAVRSGMFEVVEEFIPGKKARTYQIRIPLEAGNPFLGDADELADTLPRSLGDLLLVDADGKTTRALIGSATEQVHLPWNMGFADPKRRVLHLDIENAASTLRTEANDLKKRWCRPENGFQGLEDGLAVFQPPASVWRAPRTRQRTRRDLLVDPDDLAALAPADLAAVWFAMSTEWTAHLRKMVEQRALEGLTVAIEQGLLSDAGKVVELTDAGRHRVDQIAANVGREQKED